MNPPAADADEVTRLRWEVEQLQDVVLNQRRQVVAAQTHRCPSPDWYSKVRDLIGDVSIAAGFLGGDLADLPAHVEQIRARAERAEATLAAVRHLITEED